MEDRRLLGRIINNCEFSQTEFTRRIINALKKNEDILKVKILTKQVLNGELGNLSDIDVRNLINILCANDDNKRVSLDENFKLNFIEVPDEDIEKLITLNKLNGATRFGKAFIIRNIIPKQYVELGRID